MKTNEAPRYVAEKRGDQYVLVRVDTPMGCEDMGYLAAGAMFVLGALACGRRLRSCALLLAGGGLLYRGLTGRNPLCTLGLFRGITFDSGPTFQHDGIKASDQKPADEIDEAVMESFPASDPPATTRPAFSSEIKTGCVQP